MIKIFLISGISILFIACGGVSPQVQKQKQLEINNKIKKFNNLVKNENKYLCKAVVFHPIYEYEKKKRQGKNVGDGTVKYIFNFKNYPQNIDIQCKENLGGWCDNDIYKDFRDNKDIKVIENKIIPTKYRYENLRDSKILIQNINSNKVDIYLSGAIESRDNSSFTLTCTNPLDVISKEPKTVKKFIKPPFSDAILLKKLDSYLKYKPSIAKYNSIEKLVKYSVYISIKDLYKSLGVVYYSGFGKYPADYRVFRLLQTNVEISDDELFSEKYTKKYLRDDDSAYIMIKKAIDDSIYGNNEYEKMNGYAFADYFIKLGKYNNELAKLLDQDYSSYSSLKFPTDLKKKLYTHIFKYINNDKAINIALNNFMIDRYILKDFRRLILKSNTNHTKDMNIFLIKLFDIKSWRLDFFNGYLKTEDYTIIKRNKNKNIYKNMEDIYLILEAFVSKNKPDKITANLYSYISSHRFKNISKSTKQKILNILNKQNLSTLAHNNEYQQILRKMINDDDQRGANFYLKKGAIGDEKMILKALDKGMLNIAKKIALQDIKYDSIKVANFAMDKKQYDFIFSLINNNKLSKQNLEKLTYRALLEKEYALSNSLFNYGANKIKTMSIAKNRYDLKTMELIAKNGSAQEKRYLLEYKKELAIQKEKRKKAEALARKARIKKEQALRKAYLQRKYVGDKVCKSGRVALFLNITMSGYVERVNNNQIQIRISNTEGTTPYYNGVSLYPNKIIWDDYKQWRKCN